MKILGIRAMKGPNYWSISRQKLIVLTIDLEELEERPTNKIPRFRIRLQNLLPGLQEHQCSEGRNGGFLYRVKKGTWMGHVVEHIAIELQRSAGLDITFGQTRSTSQKGVYDAVFAYRTEKAGRYAAEAAMRIAETLIAGKKYNVEADIDKIKSLHFTDFAGPSTSAIVAAAEERGIPAISDCIGGIIQFGYGRLQRRIKATTTDLTSSLAVDLAGDKDYTKKILGENGIPVPRGLLVKDRHELVEAVKGLGYPLVLKPLDCNQGKGATIHVNDWKTALKGFLLARRYSSQVVVERYISGNDYRLLVINKKFVAAALRRPPFITGDGRKSVRNLIEELNCEPGRGEGHENILTRVKVDEMTRRILKDKGCTLDSILRKGETLLLKDTANLSTGGTAADVTETVHEENIFMAEQIAAVIGLDICGIDVISSDISMPLDRSGGAVLEVNAAPGFRMHTHPSQGKARDVARPVIDMLFPEGSKYSIPIVAVTGTNGKTTTTRLIASMARLAGHAVGFSSTDGIFVSDRLIEKGDCSGPQSARRILKNPTVDFAVLECARGGILRQGLGFQFCHTAVVTNIASDHLGLNGINTLEEMAKVKSVVPESVLSEGYAILNADDDLVYDMQSRISCKAALFSMSRKNRRIEEHIQNGGLAAVLDENDIVILDGRHEIFVEKTENIPLSLKGKALFNIENVLAAVLAGYVNHIKPEVLSEALKKFRPDPEHTPGRLNLFDFGDFELMLDYAHNPPGLRALGRFLSTIDAHKVGVITGVGDRRSEDIQEAAFTAGQIFDEIVIRLDSDLRGRKPVELIELLKEGLRKADAEKKLSHVYYSEMEACNHVIRNARAGSFIIFCVDKVSEVIKCVQDLQRELKLKKKENLNGKVLVPA